MPQLPHCRKTSLPDYQRLHEGDCALHAQVISNPIVPPLTYAEAIKRLDYPLWQKAMDTEITQHNDLHTWDLVQLPPNRVAIGSRWVFAVKTNANGIFESPKARFVAQGFMQCPGQDYYDITSPVVKMDSLRAILALGIQNNWEMHMMDVKGAYLNCPLDKEIYMHQPDSYNDGSNRVLRLRLALYGLKQAGRTWYQRLSNVLLDDGFTHSRVDECVFYKIHGNQVTIITIYVDDLGIFTSTKDLMARVKSLLSSKFTMKDLGQMTKILGIHVEINRNARTVKLSQEVYIDILLHQYNFIDANPVDTPMTKDIKSLKPRTANENAPDVPYAQVVGSLMYTAIASRLDIAFAVQQLSQFNQTFTEAHWTATKRVLRYLKGTRELGITFHRIPNPTSLIIFVDADFANQLDAKSIGGYALMYGGAIIAWNSKKQPRVALSTTEAEYMALTPAGKQLLWTQHLFHELAQNTREIAQMRCDNLQAITNTYDPAYHTRTKHINIEYHWIRERIAFNKASLTYVKSEENIADLMTKPLPRAQHNYLVQKLGMSMT